MELKNKILKYIKLNYNFMATAKKEQQTENNSERDLLLLEERNKLNESLAEEKKEWVQKENLLLE